MLVVLLALAVPLDAAPASGERITPRQEKPVPSRPIERSSPGASLWATVGSLSLVIAAILVLGTILKWQLPGAKGLLPRTVVQDLGRRPLDPRNTIHLVRCGPKILVLGSSAQGLTALSEITDPIEVDALTGLCQTPPEADQQPFGQLLKRVLGTTSVEQPAASAAPDAATERLKSRLQFLSPNPEAAHG